MNQATAVIKRDPVADPTAQLADELRPVLHKITRHMRREAISAGFSSVDVFVLGLVKRHPGIGVSELAEMEDTTRASMSAHVKRLSGAGWIKTDDSHSADSRRSPLVLTPAGLEALAQIRESSNNWLSQQIARLEPDERQKLAAAVPALKALLRRPK